MRFLAGRLLHGLFLLFGVSVLSFLFVALAPGSFLDEMRLSPQISPETVGALRAQYGLDRPLPVRYARWVRSVLRGELGFSFAYNTPAAPLLRVRARNTLVLTGSATLLAWATAIPIGVWAAARKGRVVDQLTTASATALLAVPDLLLALGLLLLAVRTGWFPTGGMVSLGFEALGFGAKVKDAARHLTLPVVTLVVGTLPVLVKHVRAALIEVLDSAFLRAARGHGIPRRRLLFRYALPAAANPLISLFGFSVGALLSTSLLVEVVMSWPGLGPLLLEAILARDLYLVIGAVMFSTVFLLAGNLLADVLLYANDPRIRTGER
ncbi:MAG: ABC transporter substrate-binding protein [Acidobacteria bacterium]|nr:MAG: ABC transporter substrate-binding protein [Acidobacteriota bacterium]